MKACLKKTLTAIGIIKALVSRTLFGAHGFACIWRVVVVKDNPLFWCLTGSLPLLLIEAIFTVKKKKGGEWKWICPSVFLYLGTTVPAIWFLELDLLDKRVHGRHDNKMIPQKKAHGAVLPGQISIPIYLKPDDWCKILEQMLLLILIIGRWLLPKGEITREQLSQLLLVYIGMAADIIELFEAFKEKQVRNNPILTLVIMSLWTASLLQFTFVLTATKSKMTRPVLFHSRSSASRLRCCPTEVISILVSVLLQDGPFLVLRMMLIFRFRVLSYTNLFFTLKNSLVIVLQFYRLVILFCQKPDRSTLVIPKNLHQNISLIANGKNGGGQLILKNGKVKKKDLNFSKNGSGGHKKSVMKRQDAIVSTSLSSTDDELKEDKISETGSLKSLELSDIDDESYIIQKALDNCILKLKDPNQLNSSSAQKNDKRGVTIREIDNITRKYGAQMTGIDDVIRNHGDLIDDVNESSGSTKSEIKPNMVVTKSKDKTSVKEERVGKGKGKSKGKKKKVKVSAEDHWKDVRKLASAIAFINETEKYRTFLLKTGNEDGGLYICDEKCRREADGLEDIGG